ncbi:MAG: RnfABCDGE type electron transport complex subunit D [Candidatus Omnitrophota bacterium]
MPDSKIIVSASPHIRDDEHYVKIMWAVFLALLPSGIWGVYAFGFKALSLILASVSCCVLAEALFLKLRRKPIAISDGSAAITGLLLAYNVSPRLPIWCMCVGAVFAIIIGKQVFGGLGRNIFNPALAGRAFLMASWPAHMVIFNNPRWQPDAVTSATPLTIIKHNYTYPLPSYLDLFIGNRGGCIGEVCVAALLLGALFLLYKKYITWHIPLTYIFTTGLLSWMFTGQKAFSGDWLFYILSGGLILGAFFMATDMATSPIISKGKIIFAVGCGVITFAIRKWGGYPEGVSYSILMMNAATPIIDRFTRPKRYGVKRGVKI